MVRRDHAGGDRGVVRDHQRNAVGVESGGGLRSRPGSNTPCAGEHTDPYPDPAYYHLDVVDSSTTSITGRPPGRQYSGDFLTKITQLIRSEEHTSELQSLMRISYAVFCLKK